MQLAKSRKEWVCNLYVNKKNAVEGKYDNFNLLMNQT